MNIEIQCCGLVMMTVIFILNMIVSDARTILYSSKLFIAALLTAIGTIVLDILSMVSLYYIDTIPEWLLQISCKIYIIGLVFEATSALVYSMYDCFSYQRYRLFAYVALAGDIASSIVIAIVPIQYNVDDPSHAYTEGPAVLMTYASCVTVLIVTLYMLIRYRKRMNPQRHRAVLLWLVSWILAAGIQFFNNALLLIGFATAIGMMVLFTVLENTIAGIDRSTGVYNLTMMHDYITEKYNREKGFSLISVSLAGYAGLLEAESELRMSLARYFMSFADAKVFRNNKSGFTLMYDRDYEYLDDVLSKLKEDFEKEWQYGIRGEESRVISPMFLVMKDSDVTKSADDIFAFSNYALTTNVDDVGSVIYLDEQKYKERAEFERYKNKLIAAMKRDRVHVYYQPIYSTEKKKFVSAEALVRIEDKHGEIIPPGMFIPIAEATGHIKELGRMVFEKVCQFIRDENPMQYGIEYIEVNLSVKQVEHQELADLYRGILDEYKIDPRRINLEITESSTIEIRQNVLDNMDKLIDFGVNFSLDDFGNGQSNLDYIIDMPVAIVKFDRNLTQSYFTSDRAKYVMKSVIQMIHDMNLKIVAEGVEEKEQLDELIELGVEYIQGYYFSKPIPQNEFLAFIKKYNA